MRRPSLTTAFRYGSFPVVATLMSLLDSKADRNSLVALSIAPGLCNKCLSIPVNALDVVSAPANIKIVMLIAHSPSESTSFFSLYFFAGPTQSGLSMSSASLFFAKAALMLR